MKKSNAFLLASLAATSSLLFHTQEAKAGINDNDDECTIKIPIKTKLLKATFGRYKGDYVIISEFPGEFNEPMRGVGKNEKRAKKSFKKHCKKYKN